MPPDPLYRIVCHELNGEDEDEIILDVTAPCYIIIAGAVDTNGIMNARASQAGPITLRRQLAALIADDELLAG